MNSILYDLFNLIHAFGLDQNSYPSKGIQLSHDRARQRYILTDDLYNVTLSTAQTEELVRSLRRDKPRILSMKNYRDRFRTVWNTIISHSDLIN